MYINQEVKKELFLKNSLAATEQDTGSPEAQIALFTFRINHLNEHLKIHRKDHSTKLGLLRLVGKRRRLLNYLQKIEIERYRSIIKKLNIRK